MSEPRTRRVPKLLWLVTAAVLMVGLCVIPAVWVPYQRDQAAIREIERLGGDVGIVWLGPEWLHEMVGEEKLSLFVRIKEVDVFNPAVGDNTIKLLSGSTHLEFLEISNTRVSDEGLKSLSSLKNLELLMLGNTRISSEGLRSLSGLTKLEFLYLENTQVSDEGLKHLKSLTQLEELGLRNTQVTEEGVKELQKALPNCDIYHDSL